MKDFLNEDFLLDSDAAKRLFHDYAKGMPILDYHSHLPAADIARDAHYPDMASVWLGGDHYKWRAMRSNGIPESVISAPKKDYGTFIAWARTMEALVGNPLYHWAHLELKRYFGVDLTLSEKTAPDIWKICNEKLARPEFGARGLLAKMNVKAVGTTDDPCDGLEHHIAYASRADKKAEDVLLFPSFRPDKAISVADPTAWKVYLAKLGAAAGMAIKSLDDLKAALAARHDFFHKTGCRISDHGLVMPPVKPAPQAEAQAIFDKAFSGNVPSPAETESFRSYLLAALGEMDADSGWTMQLHMGAIRNVNSRAFTRLGPDTGYDAVGDCSGAADLAAFMDSLEAKGKLPRTILYYLNPGMNEILGTIMGCFQEGGIPGKIQLGSAWWFNDHIPGMEKQITDLASLGLLSRFVGMLTDSRSFLSFPRHEYFRRILCGKIGDWVARGLAPADFDLLGNMVKDISYRNAANYFRLPGVHA
jgi:glucuronate isomerase